MRTFNSFTQTYPACPGDSAELCSALQRRSGAAARVSACLKNGPTVAALDAAYRRLVAATIEVGDAKARMAAKLGVVPGSR
ncbi:hypothetical protein [Phenylobacterium sp.]|uniref:hypothetical protein n=1 Tax=Phenylobacterium sp. TaxID=1871053 RepID=UPI0028112E8D|nr:hypothetical protein [Phenylobacterium sp.]